MLNNQFSLKNTKLSFIPIILIHGEAWAHYLQPPKERDARSLDSSYRQATPYVAHCHCFHSPLRKQTSFPLSLRFCHYHLACGESLNQSMCMTSEASPQLPNTNPTTLGKESSF